ncbi:MAG: gliding motility-associated ABC transporter substrate-binding protein GldG [Bacteroidales bacterium]|nr:gliding motility-associated ABC transporter substrate-binding protein GldG [Bacteroidales bacterium]
MNLKSLNTKTVPKNLLYFTGILAVLILINIISQYAFFRIDLTADKRHSLSKDSKEILKDLDDVLYIKVYLEGDLNVDYEKFRQSIEDLLYEFRIYGGSHLEYEFANPFEGVRTDAERDTIILRMIRQGFIPRNVISTDNEGGLSEKIVFPSAILYYGNYGKVVNFLYDDIKASGQDDIDFSSSMVEYNLIKAIKVLTTREVTNIAFLQGHSEFSIEFVKRVTENLSEYYHVDSVYLHNRIDALDRYEVCVIAQPLDYFSPQDKYILDQYLMKGGRLFWLVDPIQLDAEALKYTSLQPTLLNLNLDDLFLMNGIKVSSEIVRDLNCEQIEYKSQLLPVSYFPLLIPNPDHPITKNLNEVTGKFTHPISLTKKSSALKLTPLIYSSENSQLTRLPYTFGFEDLIAPVNPADFNQSYQTIGLLMEGKFESISKINRAAAGQFNYPVPDPVLESVPTKMAIIADGDIIRNSIRYSENGQILPGPISTANLNLIINTIEYLAGDMDLLALRNRKFDIRRLDAGKVGGEENFWKTLNMIVPSLLVILFGGLFLYLRKKRYSK